MPNLGPHGSWDGTTGWSGRQPPTESATLRGSGWPHKAICAFNRAPCLWWTADFNVVVGAEHGDDDWIEEVEFWLEGNTLTVSQVTKDSETGDIGFVVTIQPPSETDGDAELYATIRPKNGYERLIGPLPMVFNKGDSIQRATRYIDPVEGDDDGGKGTEAEPWASVLKACQAAASGDIVEMAEGEYLEDSNATPFPSSNARLIEFRKASGLSADQVVIDRTSRTLNGGLWRLAAARILFDAITIKLDNIVKIYPNEGDDTLDPVGGVVIFKDCVLKDTNGPSGPEEGYWNGGSTNEYTQALFRHDDGVKGCLLNCTVTNYIATGFWLYHACNLTVAADSVFLATAQASNGVSIWQPSANQPAQSETTDAPYRRRLAATNPARASTTADDGAGTRNVMCGTR